MKYFALIIASFFLFTACSSQNSRTELENSAEVNTDGLGYENETGQPEGTPKDILNEYKTSRGNMILIENFEEPGFISSPLKLRGMVPSDWVFEGVIQASLKTDKGEVLKEWYALADAYDENGNRLDGLVFFDLLLDFVIPPTSSVEFGKLTLEKTRARQDDDRDFVEIKVLFE